MVKAAKAIVETVLERRIDEVLARGTFPDAKAWCKAAGVSDGYLGTLTSRLRKGTAKTGKATKLQKLAAVAGVSVEWLLGEPERDRGDLPFTVLLSEIQMRPGLHAAILAGGYHTQTVIRALQLAPSSQAGGAEPSIGWSKLLDDIEAKRHEPTSGDAHTVEAAAARQVGKRPKLP